MGSGMKLWPTLVTLALLCAGPFWLLPGRAQPLPHNSVHLQLNTEEAEAVLAILATRSSGRPVEQSDWQRLFSTEPYIRLKKREAELQRTFEDSDFKKFVLSEPLAQRAPELRRTLHEWKKADMNAVGARVLAYLPQEARIRAKVFPVIKPQQNSFVYELTKDPTIFLYLNPALNQQQFENTVAHELHHVGYASEVPKLAQLLSSLPPNLRPAVEWMGAFGEGFAMLAAAGGPDVHPHATSPPEDRARWNRDLANFNRDLKTLEKFFLDTIEQRLATEEEIRQVGFSFFGVQGPWYTIGWRMAVAIEKRYGKGVLVECMMNPRRLLAAYNQAAAEYNRTSIDQLALWSPQLLAAIGEASKPATDSGDKRG